MIEGEIERERKKERERGRREEELVTAYFIIIV